LKFLDIVCLLLYFPYQMSIINLATRYKEVVSIQTILQEIYMIS
jgi:hypothetical protein